MTTVLEVVAGVLGIAGVLGAAVGVLSGGRWKSVIELQRESITELERQSSARERELAELRPRLAAAEARIATLTETVTSAAKVDALAALVAERHQELLVSFAHQDAHHQEVMAGLAAITGRSDP